MRRLAVLVLLLAACGDAAGGTSAPATTAPAVTTTVGAPPPTAAPAPEAAEAVAQVVEDPSVLTVAAAAAAIHDTGDPRWVPYLVDMLRLTGDEQAFAAMRNALADLTGVPPPEEFGDVYTVYGGWMYDNPVDPGAEYVEWKARLYGLIDGPFEELILQIDDPVLASRVQWGGVARGGIPELNNPTVIDADEASYMQPDELTFGAEVNGEARSYPHRILDHHELANDTLGGEPVALVDCTLCRTGVLYSRRVGDQVLQFQTSGLLINSNKIMVDVATESLWEQLTGVAIAGPLEGTELDRFFLTVTTWGDWVAENPGSGVLAIPDEGIYGARYSYAPGEAYEAYYAGDELWFPAFDAPDVLRAKEEVATLDLGEAQLAVSVAALVEAGPQLLDVGGRPVVAVPTDGGARFYDAADAGDIGDLAAATAGPEAVALASGEQLPRLQSGQSFWFAWYGAFPDTAWWPEG